jgi:hypothetical protein
MKTILKVTMLFAFVAFANTLLAMGNLTVNILPVENQMAVIEISALTRTNFSITVTDDNNRIVYYNENNDSEGKYNKVYDFSKLEDGKYNLAVVSGDLTTERQFVKKQGKIEVGDEKTNKKPFFAYEDGMLKCTYLNFSNEHVTLNFYNGTELIYSKNIGKHFNVNEGFNLSKLDAGTYHAVLVTANKEYAFQIEK